MSNIPINQSPTIPITIFGYNPVVNVNIQNAIVDTGFTGFLSVPLIYALQAGLILQTVSQSKIADGSIVPNLICLGTVIFKDKNFPGLIAISSGQETLIGMEFLNRLSSFLIDFKTKVFTLLL
ncbi:cellular and retroviral pepsin-like aspartate proteases [Candidatus Termititenax persephonae]|uniref:Cellular and retroviral pepsin-like aspartate proteases n=1 Tax=Candidatus Termititenax persephonae TaxID=2218525 RepID=A0A388THE3_9BACT|nr:cellular and retroviral pepsin-like aspartate proteases [Candidatus Termititenax persephonae]